METKFNIGDWVFVPAIIKGIEKPLSKTGKCYYKLDFEGSMPFLPVGGLINERAMKKATESELKELDVL